MKKSNFIFHYFLCLVLAFSFTQNLHAKDKKCENILAADRETNASDTVTSFFENYDRWIDQLDLSSSIKKALKTNPLFLPVLMGSINSKLYNASDLSTAKEKLISQAFPKIENAPSKEEIEFRKFLDKVSQNPKILSANIALKKLLSLDADLKVEGYSLKNSSDVFKKYSSRWRHWLNVPRAISEASKILDFIFKPSDLDDNMASFYAFHQMRPDASGTPDRYNRQRPWPKVNLKSIDASQIVGMPPELFIAIVKYAMEIEDPIQGYSWASGDALRFLSPEIARFMGKNLEQAELVRQAQKQVKETAEALAAVKSEIAKLQKEPVQENENSNLSSQQSRLEVLTQELAEKQRAHDEAQQQDRWCDSPWCKEEDRHGNMWAQLYKALSGETPNRDNPVDPLTPSPDELSALKHMFSRESTEWGATAGYVLLAAHSTGPLREAILNIAQDEVKHLSIITGAHAHLLGKDPQKRFINMVTKTLADFSEHGSTRSGGNEVNDNKPNKVVIVSILYGIEKRMRAWMKSLPPEALETIYMTPSKLPPLMSAEIPPEKFEEIIEAEKTSRMIAESRVRLTAEQRDQVVRELVFGRINKELLDRIIKEEFNNFEGAELAESQKSQEIAERINTMELLDFGNIKGWIANSLLIGNAHFSWRNPSTKDLRKALYNRLREYQIFQYLKPHQKVKDAAAAG